MSDLPQISIVIPAWNAAPFLEETIRSCLRQTHESLEVIVVNDGSSDETGAIAEGHTRADSRVRVFHSVNQGQCVARNIGLGLARGEFVKFLDSDDVLSAEALASEIAIANETGVEIVSSAEMGFTTELPCLTEPGGTVRSLAVAQWIMGGPWRSLNSALLRRDLVKRAGGFRVGLVVGEEGNLLVRVAAKYPGTKVAVLDHPLLFKRLHPISLAARSKRNPIPVSLLGSQANVEDYIQLVRGETSDSLDLRTHLLDNLFAATSYAFRNRHYGYARIAIDIWKSAGGHRPRIGPWYRDTLYRCFGMEATERFLSTVRDLFRRGPR